MVTMLARSDPLVVVEAVCLALLAAGGGSQCHYRAEAGDQAESGITPVSQQTSVQSDSINHQHDTQCIISPQSHYMHYALCTMQYN